MFPTGLGFYSIGLCLNGRGKLVSDQGALILSNLFPLEDQNKIRISSGLIIMCIIQVFLSFFLFVIHSAYALVLLKAKQH